MDSDGLMMLSVVKYELRKEQDETDEGNFPKSTSKARNMRSVCPLKRAFLCVAVAG